MTKKQTNCWVDNTNSFMQENIHKGLFLHRIGYNYFMIAYKLPTRSMHTFTGVLDYRGIDAVVHTIYKYGLKEFRKEIRRINKLYK